MRFNRIIFNAGPILQTETQCSFVAEMSVVVVHTRVGSYVLPGVYKAYYKALVKEILRTCIS